MGKGSGRMRQARDDANRGESRHHHWHGIGSEAWAAGCICWNCENSRRHVRPAIPDRGFAYSAKRADERGKLGAI